MSSLLLGPTAGRIHSAARTASQPALAKFELAAAARSKCCLWPPQSASNAHHAAPRRTTAKAASERALPEPLLSTRAFPITPKYTRAQRQGQGALSILCCATSRSPSRCYSRASPRSPTASHRRPPADRPGESWHSTLLLAPANALTWTDGKSVGLPAMVGIFRRLYDWLLSLFWYVLTVTVSSFSCRLMSCVRRCRMSPEADDGRHIASLGEQPAQDALQSRWRM